MMRIWIITSVATMVLLPQLAVAQDMPYDPAATQSCLAEMADTDMENTNVCVGRSAEQCADASVGGFSTRSMTACMSAEYGLFDEMLNVEYAKVRGLAADLDKQVNGTSFDDVSMGDRLVQMQRAWIAYRDATCAYERRQFDGGTIGELVYIDCLTTLTADQAFRLQNSVLGL